MIQLKLFTILVVTLCTSTIDFQGGGKGNLVSVVVVFRHGDRVIISPYPTDPYKNHSYWPVGWGQLTNEGKLQQFELGQWLRSRYKHFLPDDYSESDAYIRSTDVDRTLMSAEVNLAGLYPPVGGQVWDNKLPWQPIPIHTKSERHDVVLAMKKPCPKYDLLLDEFMKSAEIEEVNRRNEALYAYLAENTGIQIENFDSVEYIYSNLFIESLYNFTLPGWTRSVYPDKMKPLAELSFAVPCYTPSLARLKAGPFFHELLTNLRNVTYDLAQGKTHRKISMYSGHDTTIANVLQSLDIFERHCPPYASTILFELRHIDSRFVVNVFYKNSSLPRAMTLPGCDFDCPLERFVDLLLPVTLSVEEWEKACKSSSLAAFLQFTNTSEWTLALGLLLVCGVLIAVVTKITYSKYKKSGMIYLPLPDDDENA